MFEILGHLSYFSTKTDCVTNKNRMTSVFLRITSNIIMFFAQNVLKMLPLKWNGFASGTLGLGTEYSSFSSPEEFCKLFKLEPSVVSCFCPETLRKMLWSHDLQLCQSYAHFWTLLANSADDKLIIFFLFSPENRI